MSHSVTGSMKELIFQFLSVLCHGLLKISLIYCNNLFQESENHEIKKYIPMKYIIPVLFI